ncbi:MAG: transketolase C-terminal domain-containing protein [Bacillota bacterium]|nr:transketolase C-terminal domain-containing protein [Bacillota bacterium]
MSEEKKSIATREAYGKALAALAAADPKIVVLDADLSKSTKTAEFQAVAPERFFNAGIAEQNMLGVAAGLAAAGKMPFASSFAVFATGRAFEQIRNSIAYPRLNVKIAATHAGVTVGEDGGSHQSVADLAVMRALPNMTVLCPADGPSAAWAVRQAAAYDGPVYIRLGRLATPQLYDNTDQLKWGKGSLLRPGKDIVFFCCGMTVAICLEAAELLKNEGVAAAVADIHTLKPLDGKFISELATRCGAALTVEEHSIIGGLGSAVAEVLAEYCDKIAFSRLGINDEFGQSGSPQALLKHYGLTAENIANNAKRILARK